MAGNKSRLEHDLSQLAAFSFDGALAPHGTAVMCDCNQADKRGGLLSRELAELGRLGDQHSAGDGADPGNGTKDTGSRCQVISQNHCLLDPHFKLCNLMISKAFQLGVHGTRHFRPSQPPMRLDLRQKPFPYFDELCAL